MRVAVSSSNALPAPGRMPSSSALLTAHTASSTRSYSSFCSRSVCPPTYITPMPPVREAIRSRMWSLSAFFLAILCACHSCATRSSTLTGSILKSDLRMMVLSFPTTTLAACPRSSILIWLRSSPVFSEKYVAPTLTARSCISSCCRYPKLGGCTTQIFRLFFITFAANVLTTFTWHGDTMSSFFPSVMIGFRMFSICKMLLISMSATSTCTSSNTHSSLL